MPESKIYPDFTQRPRLGTDCDVGENSAAGEIHKPRLSTEDVIRRVVSPQQERQELQADGNQRTQRLPCGQVLTRPVTVTSAQHSTTTPHAFCGTHTRTD